MKFLFKVILIAVLTYAFEQYFPWWSIGIAAFLGGYLIKTKGLNSFLAGALGVGLIWLWMAWQIDYKTNGILTIKMAELFNLTNKNILIAITAILGSVIGALTAWTGHNLRALFDKPKRRRGYYS